MRCKPLWQIWWICPECTTRYGTVWRVVMLMATATAGNVFFLAATGFVGAFLPHAKRCA